MPSKKTLLIYTISVLTLVFFLLLNTTPLATYLMQESPFASVLSFFLITNYQEADMITLYPLQDIHKWKEEEEINAIIDKSLQKQKKETAQSIMAMPEGSRSLYHQNIDCKLHYSDEKLFSFSFSSPYKMDDAYQKRIYHTFLREEEEEVTLATLLGEHYEDVIKQNILQYCQNTNTNDIPYDIETIKSLSIPATQPFYINAKQELIIVFDQYQIAPGYMGNPQFTITKITTDTIHIK